MEVGHIQVVLVLGLQADHLIWDRVCQAWDFRHILAPAPVVEDPSVHQTYRQLVEVPSAQMVCLASAGFRPLDCLLVF
jgi:hypothetical protein